MTLAMEELETGPLHRFQDWPNEQVPKQAAGVYTIWDGDRLLYAGMSGRAMTAEDLESATAAGWWLRDSGLASTPPPLAVALATSSASTSVTISWCRALTSSQQLAAGGLSVDNLIRAFVR